MKPNCYFVNGTEMLQKKVASLTFEAFMLYMPILLDLAKGMSDMEGREHDRRGYLTLMEAVNGEIVFTLPFGEIPEEKREKYYELSQEKATRLFSQVIMHLPNGHTTSYESRNEEENKYGGAVYLHGYSTSIILSFSGMPELIDEAMMLVLADKLARDIRLNQISKIEACARNPYWKTLRENFFEHKSIR